MVVLLSASTDEVVFTSGGSEANNAVLKGGFFSRRATVGAPHIVTTQIEHPAILTLCRFLEALGARMTRLPVDSTGLVDPTQVRDTLTAETTLVSVMHANNEVDTVLPIAEIGAITTDRGIPFHTDTAAMIGTIATRVDDLGVDLLSVARRKCCAPRGVGSLYVRSGLDLEPIVQGAAHEGGRRTEAESALLAVGLGAACQLAELTTYFWNPSHDSFGSPVVRNGHSSRCLPNTLNVSFPGHHTQDIHVRLKWGSRRQRDPPVTADQTSCNPYSGPCV